MSHGGSGDSDQNKVMISRNRPYSDEDNQFSERERFCRVHRKATSAIGRSMLNILHDRSLRGRSSVHGKPWNTRSKERKLPKAATRSMPVSDKISNQTVSFKIQNESPASGKSVMDFPSSSEPKRRRAHLNSSPCNITSEIRNFGEFYAVTKFHTSYLLGGANSMPAVSTISIAFSADGDALASTHGDHTVKISCCHSGKFLSTLEGHPRTPWTVKFHPTNKYIVASGCLGFQVRVWDWSLNTGQCLNMIRLKCAIISLAFHPLGNLLAVASGKCLYLWDYDDQIENTGNEGRDTRHPQPNTSFNHRNKASRTSILSPTPENATIGRRNERHRSNNEFQRGPRVIARGTGTLIEMKHDQTLRCVHFPPEGNTIIVGDANPTREGGADTMLFSLNLWDFDLNALSHRRISLREGGRLEALRNRRPFVNRALLYNDGGFDVSPCGKFLCACAQYWLPDGVKCAVDLNPQDTYDDDEHFSDTNGSPVRSPKETQNRKSMQIDEKLESFSTPNNDSNDRISTPPRSEVNNSSALNTASTSTPSANHNSTSMISQSNSNSQTSNFQQSLPTSQYPITPPAQTHHSLPLSPPSPPGRRLIGGLTSTRNTSNSERTDHSGSPPYPPNVSSPVKGASYVEGSFVPHVVTISLEPHNLGTLLEAAPIDGAKAKGVTCVKFSPSAEFCLLGYGVRESSNERIQRRTNDDNSSDEEFDEPCHPVTSLYRIKGGMTHVSTMMSQDDDVNIARFHPHSGHGFVYGTKQGRVRILSPKPWNYLSTRHENN